MGSVMISQTEPVSITSNLNTPFLDSFLMTSLQNGLGGPAPHHDTTSRNIYQCRHSGGSVLPAPSPEGMMYNPQQHAQAYRPSLNARFGPHRAQLFIDHPPYFPPYYNGPPQASYEDDHFGMTNFTAKTSSSLSHNNPYIAYNDRNDAAFGPYSNPWISCRNSCDVCGDVGSRIAYINSATRTHLCSPCSSFYVKQSLGEANVSRTQLLAKRKLSQKEVIGGHYTSFPNDRCQNCGALNNKGYLSSWTGRDDCCSCGLMLDQQNSIEDDANVSEVCEGPNIEISNGISTDEQVSSTRSRNACHACGAPNFITYLDRSARRYFCSRCFPNRKENISGGSELNSTQAQLRQNGNVADRDSDILDKAGNNAGWNDSETWNDAGWSHSVNATMNSSGRRGLIGIEDFSRQMPKSSTEYFNNGFRHSLAGVDQHANKYENKDTSPELGNEESGRRFQATVEDAEDNESSINLGGNNSSSYQQRHLNNAFDLYCYEARPAFIRQYRKEIANGSYDIEGALDLGWITLNENRKHRLLERYERIKRQAEDEIGRTMIDRRSSYINNQKPEDTVRFNRNVKNNLDEAYGTAKGIKHENKGRQRWQNYEGSASRNPYDSAEDYDNEESEGERENYAGNSCSSVVFTPDSTNGF